MNIPTSNFNIIYMVIMFFFTIMMSTERIICGHTGKHMRNWSSFRLFSTLSREQKYDVNLCILVRLIILCFKEMLSLSPGDGCYRRGRVIKPFIENGLVTMGISGCARIREGK